MPLDLLVPDLLPRDAGSPRMRSLERWLARGDVTRDASPGRTGWLAREFQLQELPVAALERLGAGDDATGAWMRADPCHLRVEGDALRLYDASILALSAQEASQLCATLQSHFAADAMQFSVAAPDRWHVRLGNGAAPRTIALDQAAGRNVFGLLPEDARWRNSLTEAQMILNGHEVNARREREGKPAVNSVWFWGGGALPASSRKPYAAIYSDDALARGLAAWSGAQRAAVPAGLDQVDLHRADDAVLVALASGAAGEIDAKWFAPLGEALERFDRVRVILPSAAGTVIATLTGSARWRWFRPSKPLSAYA
jgi:hypothetical protein